RDVRGRHRPGPRRGRHRPPAQGADQRLPGRLRAGQDEGRAGLGLGRGGRADRGRGVVIVRIATEGQYDVPDDAVDELNELDNATVSALQSSDEAAFTAAYAELLELVRTRGTPLGDD